MSRKTPRWRAHAAALARELEALGADETGAAIGALEHLLVRLRDRRLEASMLAVVAAHPGATSNAVVERVPGDRTRALATLRELERAGLLRWEPGPKGARLWFRAKTSAAVSTRARRRVA